VDASPSFSAVTDISERYCTIAASALPNRSSSDRRVTVRERSPRETACATAAISFR